MRFGNRNPPDHSRVGSVSSALAVVFLFFGVAFIDAVLSRSWSFALLFAALCVLAFFRTGLGPSRR